MFNKITVPTILLIVSFSHSLFASPSQCVEDRVNGILTDFKDQKIRYQEFFPADGQAHFHFTSDNPNAFCTHASPDGDCPWTYAPELQIDYYPTLTNVGQRILDTLNYCGQGTGCSRLIFSDPWKQFSYPWKEREIIFTCFRV